MIFPALIWISVLMSGYAGYAGWPWQLPIVIGSVAGLATGREVSREEPYLGAHVLSQTIFQMAVWGAVYFNAIYWLVRMVTGLFGFN
jgi:hypothetical protein